MNGMSITYSGVRRRTTNSRNSHRSLPASLRRPRSRMTRTMRGHSFGMRDSKQMHRMRSAARFVVLRMNILTWFLVQLNQYCLESIDSHKNDDRYNVSPIFAGRFESRLPVNVNEPARKSPVARFTWVLVWPVRPTGGLIALSVAVTRNETSDSFSSPRSATVRTNNKLING